MQAQDHQKKAAALKALEDVKDGMVVGLGTGSTMAFMLEGLGARVKEGLKIVGIPTSDATRKIAERYQIPLTSFADHSTLDLTIDGADEVVASNFYIIKGAGGALLREKIVAAASHRLTVVVDQSKMVTGLGTTMPLPVEIVAFGYETTLFKLTSAGLHPTLRLRDSKPYLTDNGNFIADCATGAIPDPRKLEQQLAATIGVVDCGLFIGLASKVIVGSPAGIEVLTLTSS